MDIRHIDISVHALGRLLTLFLKEDKRFVSDRTRERFILTMNPRGFLRRVV